jgi:hypothetical protein
LLRAAPRLDHPPLVETVARSITYYLSQRADPNLARLSEALGIRLSSSKIARFVVIST